MDKDQIRFEEQDAPEKNTDKAFVQVGADGNPVIPQSGNKDQDNNDSRPKEGTLADR